MPAHALPVRALLAAGVGCGLIGDLGLRAPGPPGLNLSLWVAAVALAAALLHWRTGLPRDRERVTWLCLAALFAAGLAWRDSPTLKPLALAATTLAFALAAYRPAAAWVRRAGVTRYIRAWATGALHAWTAAALVLIEARQAMRASKTGGPIAWRRAAPVARGLAIAAPLVTLFAALLMSADEVFASLVWRVVRIDVTLVASHLLLFTLSAWLATGYLRGFVTGTELPPLGVVLPQHPSAALASRRPSLAITEVAIVLGLIDLLFLLFVIVQFRYLFGGDTLVQVTPGLSYAEYARRGFFELVIAVLLVMPLLLAADWLLARRRGRDDVLWRVLAGVQIVLVLAIAASALQRLRLYHASYGLTEDRFYAMVLLIDLGAMLLWFAGTVLRGRRDLFGFGALVAGLATVALLFALNPDAVVARTNLARLASAGAERFDVAYATRLSADAVPLLIDAMPALPPDVQCPLARHLLRRWPPDRERSLRSWNWSAARAERAVREHAAWLRDLAGTGERCGRSG